MGIYDTNSNTLSAYKHQTLFFGEARSVTYIDYGSTGSNAFFGGASDHCHTTDGGDPKCWAPTIVRLKPSGLLES